MAGISFYLLNNVFGMEATARILFYKIDEKYWPQLKTFLVFLNYMPIGPISAQGIVIEGYEIPLDERVSEALGKI